MTELGKDDEKTMTHSGGKPHRVGYEGQRYEVRAIGYPENGESIIGWTSSEDGAWRMATSIKKAPGCISARVIDLHTMTDCPPKVACNRTQSDARATERAEYLASYEAQIDALTREGLTREQRINLFADAAAFDAYERSHSLRVRGVSTASALWSFGHATRSLFAHLPGCYCPVMECLHGVPQGNVPDDWHPTTADLRVFSAHQIKARFG